MIWLGDWNVRVGCPRNDEEADILGPYGEQCDKSAHTNRFIELFVGFYMVSFQGWSKPEGEIVRSFYNGGDHSKRSIPDGIFVSRSLF